MSKNGTEVLKHLQLNQRVQIFRLESEFSRNQEGVTFSRLRPQFLRDSGLKWAELQHGLAETRSRAEFFFS